MKREMFVTICLVTVFAFGVLSPSVYAETHGAKQCPYAMQRDRKREMKDTKDDLKSKILQKSQFILTNKDSLGLSDDQVSKIKDIKMKVKKDTIMQDAQIGVIKVDIKAKMWEDPLDLKALDKLIDQKYDAKKAKAKGLVSSYGALKNVLTDEQKSKMKDLWETEGKMTKGMMKGMR